MDYRYNFNVKLNILFLYLSDRHISYLFLKHPPLSFTQSQFGYYSSYGTLLTCTCLLVVVPILKKRFQIADSVLYCLALGSVAVDMLIMGLSFSSWVVWLGKYTVLYEFLNYLRINIIETIT